MELPIPYQDGPRRAAEAVLAAVGLVLLAPLMATVAVLILLDTGRPVFYRGYRVGRGGHPFTMLKFRTLPNGTEGRVGSRLINPDEEEQASRLGRLLRKTKLDELPQLFNVVAGQMSLVGPRANRPSYYQDCCRRIPGYHARTLVKPGMTGLAQVFGDYYTPPQAKLRYDRLYIARRSLRLDLWLVMMTFARLAGGRALLRARPRRRLASPAAPRWQPVAGEVTAQL